jgi:hypothetical protein
VNCCTPTGYRTIFGTKTVQRDARQTAHHLIGRKVVVQSVSSYQREQYDLTFR